MKKSTVKTEAKKPKLEKRTISLLNQKEIAQIFGGIVVQPPVNHSDAVETECTGWPTETKATQ